MCVAVGRGDLRHYGLGVECTHHLEESLRHIVKEGICGHNCGGEA